MRVSEGREQHALELNLLFSFFQQKDIYYIY